jgi:hypothetical protein
VGRTTSQRSRDMQNEKDAASGSLFCKPDWPDAQKRWVAYWEMQNTDRPLLDITSPKANVLDVPEIPQPDDMEALYFDPDYIARKWLRIFDTVYFGAESIPVVGYLMGGYALGCGSNVHFDSATVWHSVTMKSIHDPLGWHPGPDDPWRHKLDRVVERLLSLAPGKFLVSPPCQTMVNDLLVLIRGIDDFMMDLATDMDQCVCQLDRMFEGWAETFDHYRKMVDARQGSRQKGTVWGVARIWHPGELMVSQSDMSCMVSGEMFERYVVREFEHVAKRYSDTIWYHLDGPGAIKHLPRLLSKPYIRVIQWVPGAGQPESGPAWMDLYREVQKAGRGLDLGVQNHENVEYLVRHLRPEGLIIRTDAESQEQADELVHEATKWCGSDANRD